MLRPIVSSSVIVAGLLAGTLSALGGGGFAEPPIATDVNPDPDIVEVFLEAAPTTKEYLTGVQTSVWAFNGTVPGPTIEAKKGDTVIVHFTNSLPEETTIHWHGVETPAQMDGAHIAQIPVPANGGTFDYQFDVLIPAMMWYHPHVKTNEQVERGLYGVLMVRDPDAEGPGGLDLPANERILVLDDILLDESGQIVEAFPSDPLEAVLEKLNGREGDTLLVNGEVPPFDLGTLPANTPERWRIVNVANSRFFRLGWTGAQNPYRIGGDQGLLESAQFKTDITILPIDPPGGGGGADHGASGDPDEGIFLAPGERADVVFTPNANPGVGRVRNYDWHKGDHVAFVDEKTGNILLGDDVDDGFDTPVVLLAFSTDTPSDTPYVPPEPLRDIPEIDDTQSKGTLLYVIGHTPPPLPPSGELKTFIQIKSPGNPLPTPLINGLLTYDVEIGDVWMIQVTNLSHADHPFHTHGFDFQAFEIEVQDDVEPENSFIETIDYTENKDTFRVPRRPREEIGTSRTILRAWTEYDDVGREGLARAEGQYPAEDVSAGWLTHCHILEHSATGMLTWIDVRYPGHTFELLGTGLAGVQGVPELRGESDLTEGAPFSLDLRKAAPGSSTTLIIGLSELAVPFKGGTLVPSPDFLLGPFPTDGNGELSIDSTWPAGVPTDTEIWYQFWTVDAAGPKNLSASNAIKSISP